jgi:hypothetical protein
MKRTVEFDVIDIVDRLNAMKRKAAVIGAAMEGYENQPSGDRGSVRGNLPKHRRRRRIGRGRDSA